MAGNKNPWRDIVSPAEWLTIRTTATAVRRPLLVTGGHRAAAVGGGGGWAFAGTSGGTAVTTPDTALQELGNQITAYDNIAKDDYTKFDERVKKLQIIHRLCLKYAELLQSGYLPGAKSVGGKQLTDPANVWVHSLGSRSLKKAGYLATMQEWHRNAKAKYKDRAQLSLFLRGLAGDHTRDFGEKLHATPYATIEKVDPFHRQTFVFLDPNNLGGDQSVNMMGDAFLDYLAGNPASNPDRATNPNASFYEWLEYHPFCIGTPGVTAGATNFKDPAIISYANQDLGYVYMPFGGMEYTRIRTPGMRKPLNTTEFGPSGKGPAGAVAFVWDADANLWLHEHGADGFVHASAKQGRKIRCSGMLVAQNGLATAITNQSGHYAPTAESIFHFTDWLHRRNCLANTATVKIEHDPAATGTFTALNFLGWGNGQFPALNLPYTT